MSKKPSQTALKVALNIIALSNVKEMNGILPNGIVDATSELLKSSEATSKKRIEKHHSEKIVSLYKKFDWLLPGQFESFGYRKAFMERNVKSAIHDGATQVLVLGAGYDTIGYRLSKEFPSVKFFEIDQPGTAMIKLKGLKKMGAADNLFILPENLGEKKLSKVLNENERWESDEKTIFTAEGLLQYLSPESVIDLFKQCHSVSGKNSRIAFTYIGKRPDGKPDAGPRTGFMLWLLKMTGEPWLWSTSADELKRLLIDTGWEYSSDSVGADDKIGIEYLAAATRK